MGQGTHGGMMQQPSAAGSAQAEGTQETSRGSMQGSGGMMGPGMMGGMMRGMMGNRMGDGAQDDLPSISRLLQQREQLGLAPEQVQQLQALAQEARQAMIRHEANAQVTEMDLEALMQADPVAFTQVEEAVKRLESQRAAIRLARLNAIAKAKTLLTPEQRQQWSTQTAAMSQAMPGMKGCPMMSGMMGHQSGT
jgi:Spy/CpxP family protein refolding chaperone